MDQEPKMILIIALIVEDLEKNKKKKTCIFCGNIKKRREGTNRKVNNKIGGLISCIIIFCFFIFSLLGLYQDITATTGYIDSRTGQYISATQMHLYVPVQIIGVILTGFVFVKVFIGWINEIKKK